MAIHSSLSLAHEMSNIKTAKKFQAQIVCVGWRWLSKLLASNDSGIEINSK